jgi:hypothetical protein
MKVVFTLQQQQARVLAALTNRDNQPSPKLANMERHDVFKYFENDPGQ